MSGDSVVLAGGNGSDVGGSVSIRAASGAEALRQSDDERVSVSGVGTNYHNVVTTEQHTPQRNINR